MKYVYLQQRLLPLLLLTLIVMSLATLLPARSDHKYFGGWVKDEDGWSSSKKKKKKLLFTDDVLELIQTYLTSKAYTCIVGPAYEPDYRDNNFGGKNEISNYDLVFYAGHGTSCHIRLYPTYSSREAKSLMHISMINPINKLKWLVFLSCDTLNCSNSIVTAFLFHGDPSSQRLTPRSTLHGCVGFVSNFLDHQTNGFGQIVWSMKDFAQDLINYLDQANGWFIASWIQAVKDNAKKTGHTFITRYYYTYVIVEAAIYFDRHSPPLYEQFRFNYSEEKIPLSPSRKFYPVPGSIISIATYIKELYGAYRVAITYYYGVVYAKERKFTP